MMEGDTPSFLYLIDNGLERLPSIRTGVAGAGATSSTRRRMRKWYLEPETRPFWSDAEDEVLGVDGKWHTSTRRRSGAGARPIRTTSRRAWTGPSSRTPPRIIRRSPSSRTPTELSAQTR